MIKARLREASFVLCLVLFPALASAQAEVDTAWTLSQKDSLLQVNTGTEGLLGGLAHEHTIVAESFTGAVSYDPASPEEMTITVALESRSLKVIDRDVDESVRNEIEANMLAMLQPKTHPSMRFVSSKATVVEGGLEVVGVMSICGQSKPLTMLVTLVQHGEGYRATSNFTLNHSDFGLEPYSAALGTIRVSDALTFRIDAQLVRP